MAAKLKKKNRGGDGSALASVVDKKNEKIQYTVQEEESLPGSRLRFKLQLTEDAVKGRLSSTYKEFNKYVNVPGFRPGHAPQALIQKRYEPAVREEMVKRMVGRLAELYTEEKGITPISRPYLLEWKSNATDGTSVELALEVSPEIAIEDATLADLKAEIHAIKVDDSYVAKSIERLQSENATFEPTEAGYAPKDGLLFTCTVTNAKGEEIIERSATEYYSVRIEDEMPEAVATALVGKKKGDVLELDVTEEVEGAPEGTMESVHYVVEIHEVKARQLPELDDEFAKDVSEDYETIGDLKAKILETGKTNEENRQKEEALERIFDQLRDRLDFDMPRALIEQDVQNSLGQMEKRLNSFGMSLRQMDNAIVKNYITSVRAQARLNVKNSLILDAITKFFNVDVTEDMVTAELEKLAAQSGRKPLAIRAQLEAKKQWDAFQNDIAVKATRDALVGKAAVTKNEVTLEAFEEMARQRQEEQAARLRGEEVKAEEQDRKEAESLNVSVEDLDQKLAEGEVPTDQ